MARSILALTFVAGIAIAGCTENPRTNADIAAGAGAGAAVASAAPAIDVFQGAAVDAAIAGLPGAVWSDPNNTGYVTGYTYKGEYHPGAPPGYDPTKHAVVSSH